MQKKPTIRSTEFATNEVGAFEYYIKSLFIIQTVCIQYVLNLLIQLFTKKQYPLMTSVISKLLLGGFYVLVGYIVFFLQPWNHNFF
jgi:hypothetical protein